MPLQLNWWPITSKSWGICQVVVFSLSKVEILAADKLRYSENIIIYGGYIVYWVTVVLSNQLQGSGLSDINQTEMEVFLFLECNGVLIRRVK